MKYYLESALRYNPFFEAALRSHVDHRSDRYEKGVIILPDGVALV